MLNVEQERIQVQALVTKTVEDRRKAYQCAPKLEDLKVGGFYPLICKLLPIM